MKPLLYDVAFRALLFSLAFLACGPDVQLPGTLAEPDCVSPCGARLYGSEDCPGFTFAEARSLATFQSPDLCLRLRGWSFHIDRSLQVGGLTWVDFRTTTLSTDEWPRSALSHEIRHLIDAPGVDYSHASWTESDLAMIEAAR